MSLRVPMPLVLALAMAAGASSASAGDVLIYVGGASGADNVYVLDPASGETKQITQNAAESGRRNEMGSFAVAPKGGRVAYLFAAVVGAELRIVGLDGDGAVTVKPEGMESCAAPSWSPDGARLAFLGSTGMFEQQVCIVDAEGKGLQTITSSEEHKTALAWSPDGGMLAFRGASPVEEGGGKSYNLGNLWIVSSSGGEPTRLSPGGGNVTAFAWSPDGASLVYAFSPRSPDQENLLLAEELWVVSASGGEPKKLTPKPDCYETEPSWSPDGQWIAFRSVRDGGSESVYAMRADGSEARLLTDNAWGAEQVLPRWSPSGGLIAYGLKDSWTLKLCVMAPDGSGQRELAEKVKDFAWTSRE